MSDVVAIVLPVFGLIAIGYCGALVGLANTQMIDGLTDFLFIFCLPVMLFKMISSAALPETLPVGYWLAYYIGMAAIWIVSSMVAARVFKCSRGETVIAGLAAGQANVVIVGTQLILKAYGDEAAFPIAMLIAVNLPITMTVASILLERSKGRGLALRPLLRNLATHPVLLGIFAGLLAKAIGFQATGVLGGVGRARRNRAACGARIARHGDAALWRPRRIRPGGDRHRAADVRASRDHLCARVLRIPPAADLGRYRSIVRLRAGRDQRLSVRCALRRRAGNRCIGSHPVDGDEAGVQPVLAVGAEVTVA